MWPASDIIEDRVSGARVAIFGAPLCRACMPVTSGGALVQASYPIKNSPNPPPSPPSPPPAPGPPKPPSPQPEVCALGPTQNPMHGCQQASLGQWVGCGCWTLQLGSARSQVAVCCCDGLCMHVQPDTANLKSMPSCARRCATQPRAARQARPAAACASSSATASPGPAARSR